MIDALLLYNPSTFQDFKFRTRRDAPCPKHPPPLFTLHKIKLNTHILSVVAMDDDFDFNEMLEEYGIDANEFNAPGDAGPGLGFGARAPFYDPAMVRQHYEDALGAQEYAGQLEFFIILLLVLVLGAVLMRVDVE